MKRIFAFILFAAIFVAAAHAQSVAIPGGGRAVRAPSTSPTDGQVPSYQASTGLMIWAANAGVSGGSAPTGTMVSSGSWSSGDLAEASDTTGTNFVKRSSSGSGNVARVTSPTFVTPTLGAATATTVNKVTITAPASGATITIPDGTTATLQGTDTYVGRTTTDTLTNKRITKRVDSQTSVSTLTPGSDSYDIEKLTAQAATLTVANPSGTPTDGQTLDIWIKSASVQTLTISGNQYKTSDDFGPLPVATSGGNKWDKLRFTWNATESTWDLSAKNFGR